ncbi:hypothetical protein ABK040_011041 [Willaertia magna]
MKTSSSDLLSLSFVSYIRNAFGALAFKNLKNLTTLVITGCTVISLGELRHLTSLKILKADNLNLNKTFNVEEMQLADSVVNVDINNNSNVTIVSGGGIAILNISNNSSSRFKYLNNLKSITTLNAHSCPLLNEIHFSNLSSLTNLNVATCQNVTGSFLTNMKQLKYLECFELNEENIDINVFKYLESFYIKGSSSLTNQHFYSCKQLRILHLFYCYHVDSSIFKYMPQLLDICIGGINVKDEDLVNLDKCEKLSFANVGNEFKGKTLHILHNLNSFSWHDSDSEHFLHKHIVKFKSYKKTSLTRLIVHLAGIEWE